MAEPTGPDPTSGAATSTAQEGATSAGQGTQGTHVPAGYAPIAALQGEQEATRKARDDTATLKAHMELAGWRFGDDGKPVAPQPPQAPARNPDEPPAEFVEALNTGDYASAWRAIRASTQADLTTRGLQTISPLLGGAVEQHKDRLLRDSPWLKPHIGDYDIVANQLLDEAGISDPSLRNYYRATPALQSRVRSELVSRNIDAYADWKSKPGRQVGTFSEGPAPGTGTGAEPPPLSPEAQEKLRQWGVTPEEMAKAAELRASGRGTTR